MNQLGCLQAFETVLISSQVQTEGQARRRTRSSKEPQQRLQASTTLMCWHRITGRRKVSQTSDGRQLTSASRTKTEYAETMHPSAYTRRQDPDCGCDLGLYVDDSTDFDLTQRYIVVTILGVSIYNCVELVPFIFATFKRYRGLYFWSLLVSILGILMSNVSNLVFNFYPNPPRLQVGLIGLVGWALMVTGQSLVLYSRLDLLPLRDRTRRWVLRVIIFNAVVMQVPIIVLNTGSKSSRPERFLPVFSIYERIQVIVFFLQEMGLSCVYLWECFRFLVIPGENFYDSLHSFVYK